MAATMATSGEAIIKAGLNVGAVPPTAWDGYIEEAEALISQVSRHDWVSNWPTISGNYIAPLLRQITTDIAGIYGIEYDMDSIGRIEAQDRIIVLRDRALAGLSLLRDQKGVTFGK